MSEKTNAASGTTSGPRHHPTSRQPARHLARQPTRDAALGEAVRAGRPGPRSAGGLATSGESLSVQALVELQALAGNASVSSLVARRHAEHEPAVQRQPTTKQGGPGGGKGKESTPDLGSLLSVGALEQLRGTATQTSMLAAAYAERGLRTVDTLRGSLTAASGTYGNAYADYARVIRAARAEAQNQQDWKNIILGIAIGTGVGLISAAIVPEGLALGWVVLAEVAGEAAEAGIAAGAQKAGITDVAGTDLEPGGLDPDVLKSAIWQRLSGLYRGVLGVQRHTQYLPLILSNTEYALGQFRLLDAGGEADMPRSDVVDMAVTLNRAGMHLGKLNTELKSRLDALNRLQAQAAAAPKPVEGDMERDIWILWMSGLSNAQSDILDLDAIEDHLESIGLLGEDGQLGVDFGWWTSEDDELEALAAARARAGTIRARYNALMNG